MIVSAVSGEMSRKSPSLLRRFLMGMARLALIASMLTGNPATGVAMSNSHETELLAAVRRSDRAVVADLLTRGVRVDARNERGQTALLIATHANDVALARLLIEAGADVNAKDDIQKSTNRYGGTALIPAAERGHVETVRTLIEAGVDVDHVNRLGWTALLEAVILGDGGVRHVEIVRLLKNAGANIGIADKDGVTALQHARSRGYGEIVRILERP